MPKYRINQIVGSGILRLSSSETYEDPAYANAGGTGNRTTLITFTTNFVSDSGSWNESLLAGYVDGVLTDIPDTYWHDVAVAGKYLRAQFLTKVLITEVTLRTDPGYDGAFGTSTWKVRGSNNGSTWDDLCAAISMPVIAGVSVFALTNTTGYSYYEIAGAAGSLNGYMVPQEVEYKIGNPA